jgi:hypothetical protein
MAKKAVAMMNCEEFGVRGLDLDRADADPLEAAAAAQHARVCGHCNAVLESWREVKSDLRLLSESTRLDSAPARVQMRLKQELRTRREARVPRSTLAVASWAMASAAALIGAVGWGSWQRTYDKETAAQKMAVVSPETRSPESRNVVKATVSESRSEDVLPLEPKKTSSSVHPAVSKEEDAEKFTLLPGSLPAETREAAIVRVRMQRGALGAWGLPVNEERAGEWIQVDLLVGNDGLPQAVRLAR